VQITKNHVQYGSIQCNVTHCVQLNLAVLYTALIWESECSSVHGLVLG